MDNFKFIDQPVTIEVRAYSQYVPFYRLCTACEHTLITNDTLYPLDPATMGGNSRPVAGFGAIYRLIGDGSHQPAFAATLKQMGASEVYDMTLGVLNIITFLYDGAEYWYSISRARTSVSKLVTKKYTIGHPGHTGVDFTWTSEAGHVAQNLDLGAIIPALAKVIDIQIVCTEAVVGNTDMTIGAGNASGGAQYIVAASCNALNEIRGCINPALYETVLMSTAATNIWLTGDPSDANWADMSAGKWNIFITYLAFSNF